MLITLVFIRTNGRQHSFFFLSMHCSFIVNQLKNGSESDSNVIFPLCCYCYNWHGLHHYLLSIVWLTQKFKTKQLLLVKTVNLCDQPNEICEGNFHPYTKLCSNHSLCLRMVSFTPNCQFSLKTNDFWLLCHYKSSSAYVP